jgi:hypothetical protein
MLNRFFLRFSIILFVTCIYSCEIKPEKIIESKPNFDLISFLEKNDSVDCWATQWINYYDVSTLKSLGNESSYNGVYLTTKDSIYSFFYPCEYFGTAPYKVSDDSIYSENLAKKITIKKDSLYLEEVNRFNENNETVQCFVIKTYLKRKFLSSDILYLLSNKKLDGCDTTEKFQETINWQHQDNLVFLYYPYQ